MGNKKQIDEAIEGLKTPVDELLGSNEVTIPAENYLANIRKASLLKECLQASEKYHFILGNINSVAQFRDKLISDIVSMGHFNQVKEKEIELYNRMGKIIKIGEIMSPLTRMHRNIDKLYVDVLPTSIIDKFKYIVISSMQNLSASPTGWDKWDAAIINDKREEVDKTVKNIKKQIDLAEQCLMMSSANLDLISKLEETRELLIKNMKGNFDKNSRSEMMKQIKQIDTCLKLLSNEDLKNDKHFKALASPLLLDQGTLKKIGDALDKSFALTMAVQQDRMVMEALEQHKAVANRKHRVLVFGAIIKASRAVNGPKLNIQKALIEFEQKIWKKSSMPILSAELLGASYLAIRKTKSLTWLFSSSIDEKTKEQLKSIEALFKDFNTKRFAMETEVFLNNSDVDDVQKKLTQACTDLLEGLDHIKRSAGGTVKSMCEEVQKMVTETLKNNQIALDEAHFKPMIPK